MTKLVYEVLDEASKIENRKDKIKFLKQHESWALKDVLRGTFDETIHWLIPEGKPPFTPSNDHNPSSNLLRQNVQFAYFVKGGKGEKMMKAKREQIFITLLESIHPKDAEIVISMVNKKMAYKGITKALVKEAFPDLIKE